MTEYLLASDLDGTLLGDDAGLEAFAAWHKEHASSVRLVYATGRFFEAVQELVAETALPAPEAVIGGVGSDIRRFPSGDYVKEWHQKIGADWDPAKARAVLESIPQVEMQPDDCQSDYKVSGYFYDAEPSQLDDLKRRLDGAGIHTHIIYSSQRDLDILPGRANKGTAVEFYAEVLKTPAERVMVSGDSGNDLALYQHGFRGIVVGNAHPELKALTDPSVYHATRPMASGVVEGLEHWLNSDSSRPRLDLTNPIRPAPCCDRGNPEAMDWFLRVLSVR